MFRSEESLTAARAWQPPAISWAPTLAPDSPAEPPAEDAGIAHGHCVSLLPLQPIPA